MVTLASHLARVSKTLILKITDYSLIKLNFINGNAMLQRNVVQYNMVLRPHSTSYNKKTRPSFSRTCAQRFTSYRFSCKITGINFIHYEYERLEP